MDAAKGRGLYKKLTVWTDAPFVKPWETLGLKKIEYGIGSADYGPPVEGSM